MSPEQPSCCSICCVDDAIIECLTSGEEAQDRHGFCRECLQGYAKANFEFNGEYERDRDRGGLVSAPGELPCPHFIQGACSCTVIVPSTLRRFIDDETFDMWRKADVRLGMAAMERERQEAEAQFEEAEEARIPLDNLRGAVQEALTRGRTVCCPECSTKGEKDDQCMHIKCASCRTEWCYCCGRRRGRAGCSREHGCDSTSPFLEAQPGWNGYALHEESDGQGAVHELHRQRIAYFLKLLKHNTDVALWTELRAGYPNILDDVPTDERGIDWDEIDGAEVPTFGNTAPADIKWADEGQGIVADLEERLEDAEVRSNRSILLQRRFAQFVSTGVDSLEWKWVAFDLLMFIALLAASVVTDDEATKIALATILCSYITIHLVCLVGFAIDWRYTILSSQEGEWLLPYSEVQFCGSRDEQPYLSSAGRWRLMKVIYFVVLFSCLSFGVFLTLFFKSWSEDRCIANYGVCGLGPALLVFAGVAFGGGTLLINISPPPLNLDGGRQGAYRSNMRIICLLGGFALPIGAYLMVGFADPGEFQIGWIVGAVLVGLSTVLVLAGLSRRFFSVRGFTLDRRMFISYDRHLLFWMGTVLGLFILATSNISANRALKLVFGTIFSVCPTLLVLIGKIRSSP